MSYTIERKFPVSPERLFRALTEPADLVAWIWGPYGRDVRATVDLVVGGQFQVTTNVAGRGWGRDVAGMRGVYAEVRPPTHLVHTLHWDAPVGYNAPGMDPVDEVVVVDIEPDPAGSRIVYSHLGIPDDGVSAAEHQRSVHVTFDLLERHLAANP